MDTISIQNTKTLEKVFTSELQQRKLIRQNRRQLLLGVFMITTIILGLYIFTPLFELINY
jgi:hypothetical protein